MEPEVPPFLRHRARLLVQACMVGHVAVGKLREGKGLAVGRPDVSGIDALGYQAKQAPRFIPGGIGCPGRSVPADCVPALPTVDPVFEDIDPVAALAADTETPHVDVPLKLARL